MSKLALTSSVYTFANLKKGNFLYVDKTAYLWQLIKPASGMYFLSRPRRFGKSLTVSTLKAIFQGKKELFKGLAIYDKPYDWKPYPVIHFDMNGRDFTTAEALLHSLSDMVAGQACMAVFCEKAQAYQRTPSIFHKRMACNDLCESA